MTKHDNLADAKGFIAEVEERRSCSRTALTAIIYAYIDGVRKHRERCPLPPALCENEGYAGFVTAVDWLESTAKGPVPGYDDHHGEIDAESQVSLLRDMVAEAASLLAATIDKAR